MKQVHSDPRGLVVCDHCGDSEVEDCMTGPGQPGGPLRAMYDLEDGSARIVCQKCLEALEANRTLRGALTATKGES